MARPMAQAAEKAFAWYDPRSARVRLAITVLCGVAGALAAPAAFGWPGRLVWGWDAGAFVLLGLSWIVLLRADAAETKRRAAAEDPGRTTVLVTVLLTAVFSLFAATYAMKVAKALDSAMCTALVIACIGAVIASWTVTHTSYTFRYAHLYYRDDGDDEGGLQFPGNEEPSDVDFAYFAFVIGMCFQTSDVSITTRIVRRDVLVHSVLSFFYNTAIVALTLNLVFGFLGN